MSSSVATISLTDDALIVEKQKLLILFYHFDITIPENHHEVLLRRFPDSQLIQNVNILIEKKTTKQNHPQIS